MRATECSDGPGRRKTVGFAVPTTSVESRLAPMSPTPDSTSTYTIHWPEPAHLRLKQVDSAPEPCEIEFNDGTTERGELLRFTGRDEHLVFRPEPGHPRHPTKIVVRTSRFKRLRLTNAVVAEPLDAQALGAGDPLVAPAQVQVYNVEFTDHEIESGETNGFVRNAIGLFLFLSDGAGKIQRSFVPETGIAYFQAGDPIGRLLVEENAVSEEQLKAAVEKQQEMRKLVLGDYLIEEGLIEQSQLDAALTHQKTKPSLRLGEALIELGYVKPETLQIALARQRANRGRPLGQILVDMGVLDTDTLTKIHAKKMGRPFISLATFTPSAEAVRAIGASTARRLGVMPLSIEHGDLIVASESQLDASAVNELTLSSRMRVVQVMAPGQEIAARQLDAYGAPSDDNEVRFEGIEVHDVGTTSIGANGDLRVRESLAGGEDPHLLRAIERALSAVESGGVLEIRIEARDGSRETTIRYSRP